MSKRIILCMCALVVGQIFIAGCEVPKVAIKNPEALAKIKRIAVMPFSDGPGVLSRQSGEATAGFVMTQIKYDLVERTHIKKVFEEHKLQISSLTDPSTAKKAGKLLGVDAIMVGSVSQYEHSKGYTHLIYFTIPTNEYTIGATIRIIDVFDGKVIYRVSGCGKSGNSFDEAGTKFAKAVLAPLPK